MLTYGECLRCGHAVTLVSIVPTFDQDHEIFTFACRECRLPRQVSSVVVIGMIPVASGGMIRNSEAWVDRPAERTGIQMPVDRRGRGLPFKGVRTLDRCE